MALTDIRVPYELLIRYGEDGAPRGAHVQFRRIVTLDDERLRDEVLPAEPLDVADLDVSPLMAETTRAALARVSELQGERETLIGDLAARDAEIGRLRDALDQSPVGVPADDDARPEG